MFDGVKYVPITELGLSQIYLNKEKLLKIKTWFNPSDLTNFQPLPVHDFGNGRLTLTDGHSRAFIAYKYGLKKIPIIYDKDEIITSETGQLLYKNDIVWCKRFQLHDIRNMEERIISNIEYQKLWVDRCNKAYYLLTQTTESQREQFNLLHPDLFLYGSSEKLDILFFENKEEQSFEFPVNHT